MPLKAVLWLTHLGQPKAALALARQRCLPEQLADLAEARAAVGASLAAGLLAEAVLRVSIVPWWWRGFRAGEWSVAAGGSAERRACLRPSAPGRGTTPGSAATLVNLLPSPKPSPPLGRTPSR